MKQMHLLILFLLTGATLFAEDPFIGMLYPAGGQQGTTVSVEVAGQRLRNVKGAVITGNGVVVKKIIIVPNFPNVGSQSQRDYLVGWLKNIHAGKPGKPPIPEKDSKGKPIETQYWRKCDWWDKLDQLEPRELLLVEHNLYFKKNALQSTPSLSQTVLLDVEIAPDAAPGVRELRLYGNSGISAPKLFYVDACPHVPEPPYTPPYVKKPDVPQVKTIPVVLDGQIMPGETDRFKLTLEKDKTYTVTLVGRHFLPFIGDAVPGHFQPVLNLIDPEGKPEAFADDDAFRPDPVLRFKAKKSGVYTLEVRDNLYRGRKDFVYRALVEEGYKPYRFDAEPYPELPRIAADAEGKIPVDRTAVLPGKVTKKEGSTFRFDGKAGQMLIFEGAARRSGSPLDGVLRLTGPDGKVLAEADDSPCDLNVGEVLQQIDPYLAITLPADGTYTLTLFDRTGNCGGNYRFWLRVGPPKPDFRVYTASSMYSHNKEGGVKIFILPIDGFSGDLRITAEPEGLPKAGIPVPAGSKDFLLKLTPPAPWNRGKNGKGSMDNRRLPVLIRLYAESKINGEVVRHKVIPCDTFSQAFAYDHLLPAQDFYLFPRNRWQGANKNGNKNAKGKNNKNNKNGKNGKAQQPAKPASAAQPAKSAKSVPQEQKTK